MTRLTRADQQERGYRYAFDPSHEPLCSISPGDELTVESEDAYHGQVIAEGHRNRETEPRSNPLSGPIAVAGAEPGDALAVHIDSIRPLDGRASTYVPSWWWYLGSVRTRRLMDEFLETRPPTAARELPVGDAGLKMDGYRIPYKPMLGTVGTAPSRTPTSNVPAGPHGGNMDLPIVRPGSTLYLPISTPEALLYLGDAHAAQGDAEVTGVAAEMSAETTLQVDVIEGLELAWPRVETDDTLYAVAAKGTYSSFEDAIRLAYVHLVDWLTNRGHDRYEALRLVALAGTLLVGNFNCVAAGIEKSILERQT